jgi:hypothetical protein
MEALRHNRGGARAEEGVEHPISLLREELDEPLG